MADWISFRKHLLVSTGSDVHFLLTGTARKCKCAQSPDTAGVLGLSLGKQPGAGGANWIQLFCDSQGMMLTFPQWIFQILQKLEAKLDKWTKDKACLREAGVLVQFLDYPWMSVQQTKLEQHPSAKW